MLVVKCLPVFSLCFFSLFARSQNLQLHYDFRHTLDAQRNAKNYPSLYFEYFKGKDSGSFLIKLQADFIGEGNNIGKSLVQVSHSFRFWRPRIFLQLEYSGGLGVAEPSGYGFYLTNAFSLGIAHPFQSKGTWFNAYICYTYSSFRKPSHDALFSFYWWKGLYHFKLEFAGDFSIWTRNKNRGDVFTINETGKRFSFFGEPQLWLNLSKNISAGSKINLYYHVLIPDNLFLVYPTVALKYKI